MRSKILFELRKAYEPFSVLWNEWAHSAHCLLTADEIYTMEVHLINKFQMDVSDFVMYYNKRENTLELIRKLSLKSQYRHYKDFIIKQFEKKLLNLITREKLLFASAPIQSLPISKSQKAVLLKFKKTTIGEITQSYATKDLCKPEVFTLVLEFLKAENL